MMCNDANKRYSKELYRQCREAGVCVVCGNPTQGGKALCPACALKQSNRNIKRYNQLKAEGLCTVCGKRIATNGFMCLECYSKYSTKNRPGIREAKRARDKALREAWRGAGLCTRCGASRRDSPTKYCPECRAKINEYAREWGRKQAAAGNEGIMAAREKAKKLYAERKVAGLCVYCGQPKEKDPNNSTVYCSACREKINRRNRERRRVKEAEL